MQDRAPTTPIVAPEQLCVRNGPVPYNGKSVVLTTKRNLYILCYACQNDLSKIKQTSYLPENCTTNFISDW